MCGLVVNVWSCVLVLVNVWSCVLVLMNVWSCVLVLMNVWSCVLDLVNVWSCVLVLVNVWSCLLDLVNVSIDITRSSACGMKHHEEAQAYSEHACLRAEECHAMPQSIAVLCEERNGSRCTQQ